MMVVVRVRMFVGRSSVVVCAGVGVVAVLGSLWLLGLLRLVLTRTVGWGALIVRRKERVFVGRRGDEVPEWEWVVHVVRHDC